MKSVFLAMLLASTVNAQIINLPNQQLFLKAASNTKIYTKAEVDSLWSTVPVCIKDGASLISANTLFTKTYTKKDCSQKKVEMYQRLGKKIVILKVTELPAELLKVE